MSFDIEFTGSLVDNRNLSEISTNSLLTKTTQGIVSPNGWEFNVAETVTLSSADTVGVGYTGDVIKTGIGASGFYTSNGSLATFNIVGTSNEFVTFAPITFFDLLLINGQNYTIQVSTVTGFTTDNVLQVNFDLSSSIIASPNSYGPGLVTFNFTASRQFLRFLFNGNFTIDYFRVFSDAQSPVTITPSTLVNGANKTGGTLITPTVQTLQDGSPAISGPANRFGLNVRDNGTTKLAPQFFPSALDSEESSATITEEKTITAESTSLSVEGTGLGGTEKIERGSSVIVEDVTSYGEN